MLRNQRPRLLISERLPLIRARPLEVLRQAESLRIADIQPAANELESLRSARPLANVSHGTVRNCQPLRVEVAEVEDDNWYRVVLRHLLQVLGGLPLVGNRKVASEGPQRNVLGVVLEL